MKTKSIYLLFLVLGIASINLYSQTATQNYIQSKTYTKEDATTYMEAIQYFDGLGRPVQTVQRGITPDAKDLVSIQEYDAFGRESNAWLPGKVTTANNGAFVALETAKGYIKASNAADQKPYSMPVYEASPLNRVLKQFGPGQDWHNADNGQGKAVKTVYKTNLVDDATLNCVLYKVEGSNQAPTLTTNNNYSTGTLYVTEMADEDGNTSYEFKDKLGQVVLTRQIDRIAVGSTNEPFMTKSNNYVLASSRNLYLATPAPNTYTGVEYKLSDEVRNSKTNDTYTISFDVIPNIAGRQPFSTMVIGAPPVGDPWSNRLYHRNFQVSVNSDGSLHYSHVFTVNRTGGYSYGYLQRFLTEVNDGTVGCTIKNLSVTSMIPAQAENGAYNDSYDTYYVYNDYGNLCFVLPPRIQAEGWSQDKLDLLAYQYKYDNRNRCIWKKLPGAEPVYYVYDKADRLIFTQDGEQRAKGEWLFSIPDALGRPVLTGICKNTLDYAADPLKNVVVSASWSKATNTYKGYTIAGITLTLRAVLSASYYDNYEFMGLNSIPPNTDANFKYTAESGYGTWYGTDYADANKYKNKGLLTGTLTTRYQSDGAIALDYLYSVMYYDNKARLIQAKSNNHLGGIEKEYIAYNFTGQPTKKMHIHSATGKNTLTEVYTYSYDHAGRLLTTTHQLTDGTAVKGQVTLAENSYDDLGRLKTNMKGGQANAATTYGYNIRSWTKSITSPLFTETLYYNESYGGSVKQYNGNISAINWQVQGESYKRGYSFAYDNLSRLTTTNYLKDGVVQVHATNGSTPVYQTVNTYDKHGNIKTMQRYGKTAAATYGLIDNLTFDYTGTGNQLRKVTDAVANFSLAESADFKNYGGTNSAYTYNKNGAMASDSHKGILGIKYNSLNLPYELLIKNTETSGKVYYTYTASGVKLNTKHMKAKNLGYTPATGTAGDTNMDVIKTTDYVGSVIYEGGVLKRILVDGGYYEGGVYYYYLSDHLGNNRVVANQSGTVIQKNHYYPFGMAFAEGTAAEQGKQPYKYNGKEMDPLLGLNMYDYSARYYESAIGRFTTVDPLAEKYYSWSPYVYVKNNPMKLIDPTGMYDIKAIEKNKQYGVVAVYQENYADIDKAKGNTVLADDIKAAQSAGVPVIFVKNVADYANAMAAMANQESSTETYTINSHGAYRSEDGTEGFYIGTEYVNAYTDVSLLKDGLAGKDVFIGACSVTSNDAGIKTIENFSGQTLSTVYAKNSWVASGYKYDGGGGLSSFNMINQVAGVFGINVDNGYHMSSNGRSAVPVYNVNINISGKINSDSGNRSFIDRGIQKHIESQIVPNINFNNIVFPH